MSALAYAVRSGRRRAKILGRTVGITEVPTEEFLDRLKDRYGFEPPRKHGHNVVTALEAMVRGEVRVFIGLGGNFTAVIPDWQATRDALRTLDLTVQISTMLNRGHLAHGRHALILPCLGRTEIDMQATGPQSATVACMSIAHASKGVRTPASEHPKSAPAIIAGMACATLGSRLKIDWKRLVGDYALIREEIEAIFPIFEGYNARFENLGEFHPTALVSFSGSAAGFTAHVTGNLVVLAAFFANGDPAPICCRFPSSTFPKGAEPSAHSLRQRR